MDISDNYDYQQSQQECQQQAASLQAPQSSDMRQQNDMQCEPIYTTSATASDSFATNTVASDVLGCAPMSSAQTANNYDIVLPLPSADSVEMSSSQMQQQKSSTDVDIDSLLLQQFSCLGTTDHEDLINQFQTLMNNQTTKDSAKFFLEMSNWNLQAAVGCYLDYFNGQTLPTMKIVLQARPTAYQQAWRVRNEGNDNWPNGCYLISSRQEQRIEVPALRSGECCDIVAELPPAHPAMSWRFCTPYGSYFGESIVMVGANDAQSELSERMAQLHTSQESGSATDDMGASIKCLQVKVVKVNLD